MSFELGNLDEALYNWRRSYIPPLSHQKAAGPFVYFIACGGRVKIGYAENPERRLDELSRECDNTIRHDMWDGKPKLMGYIRGDRTTEAELHRKYASQHVIGEWFDVTEELAAEVLDAAMWQALCEIRIRDYQLTQAAAAYGFEHHPMDESEDAVIKHALSLSTRYIYHIHSGHKLMTVPLT